MPLLELDMGPVRRRASHFESVVSICLLAILFLIGVGVFIKQLPGEDLNPLASCVPSGFEALSEIKTYHSDNLYEKINGKAPLYIESGFEKLATQLFEYKDDENLQMELYLFDMGTAKNAFSVYSVQKRADTEILPDMQFAYRTSNALYLIHGQYYIELVGFSESDKLLDAMAEFGRKVRTNLAVDDTQILELNLFPPESIVSDSIKLYVKSAFGFEGLTDIFSAAYELDGRSITAFLSKRTNRQDAQKTSKDYYNFLIENGGEVKPTVNQTVKAVQGKIVDLYGEIEIVFATGKFVGGVHGAENQQLAEKLAERLINRLSEEIKATNND